MPRTNNHVASREKRKKVLNEAKGNWGARGNVYTVAKGTVEKGLQHAYTHRKNKKREFRKLWITRINASARNNGTSYSKFINDMFKAGISVNRKTLAALAVDHPDAFTEIVKFVSK